MERAPHLAALWSRQPQLRLPSRAAGMRNARTNERTNERSAGIKKRAPGDSVRICTCKHFPNASLPPPPSPSRLFLPPSSRSSNQTATRTAFEESRGKIYGGQHENNEAWLVTETGRITVNISFGQNAKRGRYARPPPPPIHTPPYVQPRTVKFYSGNCINRERTNLQ